MGAADSWAGEPVADPADMLLPVPHAGTPAVMQGSRDGRYWARTSDPQLVELVLSQLS